MYLNNQQPDQAITILQALSHSADQAVASRASQSLEEAREFRASMEAARVRPADPRQDSEQVPSLRLQHASAPDTSAPDAPVTVLPNKTDVRFIKGSLSSVDCSSAPIAVLTVSAGGKSFSIRVPDSKHVLLIGADEFSCAWKKQKVAINYRETGEAAGTAISIEVQ